MHRVNQIVNHLSPVGDRKALLRDQKTAADLERANPQSDNNPVRWHGWGYKDTAFTLNNQGQVTLTGDRYLFSGKSMPSLRTWMEENAGLNINNQSPCQTTVQVPKPIRHEGFLSDVKDSYNHISFDASERLFHARGHTCQEIFMLRYGIFKRVPDVVIYPGSHEHVEAIVQAAVQHNIVIIPFGGGTSVSQAVMCPEDEKRMIVSLDMKRMNKIKWINRKTMLACIEAGVVGKDLEMKLRKFGLMLGHEPDSMEFSSLGGWVSTRASGMRKNRYGNIEDIVRKIKMVTPTGTLERDCEAPRVSNGPDLNHIMMGSEGTMGVVTEVVVRLSVPAPVTRYGSMIFPDFESGVACMHEIGIKKCAPVSIRLVDNTQFQFGQALKPAQESWKKGVVDKVKKWYVLNRLKFDPNKMVAATLLFEGSKSEVDAKEKKVYAIAAKYGGMKAGEENGVRGYFLTYMIGYLRDFGLNYEFMAESFETSICWDNVLPLCNNVKERIRQAAEECGVTVPPFVSCRVTQAYDTGACVYFYFGFLWTGLADPIGAFSHVEHSAREEILKLGGSLSHHHGIGKLRKGWMERVVGPTGMTVLKSIKQSVDPQNIFAVGNMGL